MEMADDLNLPIAAAFGILDTILGSITDALVAGDNVEIRGFGSFTVRHYDSYIGRKPKSGEKIEVKPKKLPHFKVGLELKKAVENGGKLIENQTHDQKHRLVIGKNLMEGFIPDQLEFMIGGFFQGQYSVKYKDGKLLLGPANSPSRVSDYGVIEVMPTPSEWKIFWHKVDQLQVWKWKKSYSNRDVLDGEQWSLRIKINGKTLASNGSNSYPGSFKPFLNILSKLAGGLSLHPQF